MQQIDPTVAKPSPANIKVIHVKRRRDDLGGQSSSPSRALAPTTDDMAAITPSVRRQPTGVGVLWSNQTAGEEAFYFAAHTDGAADGTWGARETAFGGAGTGSADGHISLKTDAERTGHRGGQDQPSDRNRPAHRGPRPDRQRRCGRHLVDPHRLERQPARHAAGPRARLRERRRPTSSSPTSTTAGHDHHPPYRAAEHLNFGAAVDRDARSSATPPRRRSTTRPRRSR